MARFIHVGFGFAGVPKVRDLEPAFTSLNGDWIRYSALCWIVWTEKTAAEIFWTIKPFLDAEDQVLIAPIDLRLSFGFLSPWVWGWMATKDPNLGLLLGPTAEIGLLEYSKLISGKRQP